MATVRVSLLGLHGRRMLVLGQQGQPAATHSFWVAGVGSTGSWGVVTAASRVAQAPRSRRLIHYPLGWSLRKLLLSPHGSPLVPIVLLPAPWVRCRGHRVRKCCRAALT